LIEEVENFDHHPSRFVPQGLEPQRRQVRFVQIFTHTWLAGHSGAPPASQSDLGMLEEVDVDGGECAICQEDLGENCRRMRCGHIYHFQCLMPWLGIHNTCPVCRLPIV
jgi:E3 ubiquitin-protein ligase RNF115/126